jgi:hypothetical protein
LPLLERDSWARNQRLTPVILATQEADIRRISVQSQLGQIVHETLSQKNPTQKKGWQSGSRCRLSSNRSTAKEREKKKREFLGQMNL